MEGVNRIGRRIMDAMGLEGREHDNLSMEFQVSNGIRLHNPRGKRLAASSRLDAILNIPLTAVQREQYFRSAGSVLVEIIRQPFRLSDSHASRARYPFSSWTNRTYTGASPFPPTDPEIASLTALTPVRSYRRL